ncbi:MAG: thioredoxin family protein [Rhodospirillales bacterium]|nr:thioredoxin family protein [Rhodospirillales bacterium]
MTRTRTIAHSIATAGLLSALAAALPVSAETGTDPASAWAETEQTAVRLVSAVTAVGDGDSVPLGLEFKLKPGWKIYWRSPGDAGFPPRPDWSTSENLIEAAMRWPAPERFSVLGLETLGYKKAVVLPIEARLAEPGEPLRLRTTIDYLTCDDICIPYKADLALDLPAGEATPSAFAHLINRYSAMVPGDGARHGLSIESIEAPDGAAARSLRISASALTPFDEPDLFVEGPIELVFDKPILAYSADRLALTATVPVDGEQYVDGGLIGTPLTVTLVDGARSAERTAKPISVAVPSDVKEIAESRYPILTVLALALLGGLILNLMPCVLPVLSIKLLGVVGQGGRRAAEVRIGFIASAAGIVFSFLVLAAGLIAFKAAGGAIGWGIQFQNAWFLIAMGLVVVLFACNLWGFLEFRLPGILAAAGGKTGETDSLAGHFLTGAFATLLATPCSAPFLGTAVGFALSRGAVEIFWVFTALGIGLALPYLAVAAVPALATWLPRPGPWMIVLRRILGFALAATALWLVTVLAGVISPMPAGIIGFLFFVMICFLAAGSRFGEPFKLASQVGSASLALVAMIIPVSAGGTIDAADSKKLTALWQPFDEAAIARKIADGKTVFVDVTADWCVTCQVNKTFILGRQTVVARLRAPNVVAMQADWTRPNDGIARYLAGFGRYGIPFNVVYGPGNPGGIVLPELLTEKAVEDALKKASGG